MNKTTFGNSQAAHILVEMLEEINNGYITAKVMRFYNDYMHEINVINSIPKHERKVYVKILHLLTERRYVTIDSSTLPKKVQYFLRNTINASFKEIINQT